MSNLCGPDGKYCFRYESHWVHRGDGYVVKSTCKDCGRVTYEHEVHPRMSYLEKSQ